jgi:hypothetical protein
MYKAGHQIGSHTWSHQNLSQISSAQRRNQILFNERAISNIIGAFPTYMRPPFSECNADCMSLLESLGYHIVYFDLDTDDTVEKNVEIKKKKFADKLSTGPQWLVIGHDIIEDTVKVMTEFMLKTLTGKGFRAVSVGECLGDPQENWYRDVSGSKYIPVNPYTPVALPELNKPSPPSSPSSPSPPTQPSADTPDVKTTSGVTVQDFTSKTGSDLQAPASTTTIPPKGQTSTQTSTTAGPAKQSSSGKTASSAATLTQRPSSFVYLLIGVFTSVFSVYPSRLF